MERRTLWTIWALAALTGCPLPGDEEPEDSADTSITDTATTTGTPTDTAPQVRTVEGVVTRSVSPAEDGVGTLFVAALDACDLGANFVGATSVPGADLSVDGAEVTFTLPNLPPIEVHLAVFLDDNGDADPYLPQPGPSDLVYGTVAQDGSLDCVAVDLSIDDASGVAVDLGLLVPAATP